jgi:hypothetical protein
MRHEAFAFAENNVKFLLLGNENKASVKTLFYLLIHYCGRNALVM